MGSIALDGVHQVGNQVGTTLVLAFYIGPLLANGFVGFNKVVVLAHAPHEGNDDQTENND